MRKKSIILAIALVFASSVLTMACAKENGKNTYLHDDKTEKNEQTDARPGVEEKQELEEKLLLEETPIEEFKYEYDAESDGIIIKTYYGKETNIVIPKEADGKTVIGIDALFRDVDSVVIQYPLKFVKLLESNITDISFAEGCEVIVLKKCYDLTEVHIPKGYVRADFYQCERLKSILLPSETERQDILVEKCPEITSIVYPEGTEVILGGFLRNKSLQTIEFPSTIKRMIPELEEYNESMRDRSESKIQGLFSNYPKERYEIEALPFYFTFENDNLNKLVFHMRVKSAPDSILKEIKEGVPTYSNITQIDWDDETWIINEDVKKSVSDLSDNRYSKWAAIDEMKDEFWIRNKK